MYKILAILVCFISLSRNAYAHPPSDINLAYSQSKQAFTLTINHRVSGKGHFIKQITVKLNNNDLQSKTYQFQNNKNIVIFSFPAPGHKKDDVLSVEATCNRTGPVSKDFSIDKVLEQYNLKGQAAKEASPL
ncbi:MAG: hypothetical protein L6416_07250 [Candidatus Omnitrophica bacterium]|nr:hypothetical protein [Candidatus Omnitrophota bacterium]